MLSPVDQEGLRGHVARLAHSHQRWVGRPLFPGVPEPEWLAAAWLGPFVLVSHGTETDPVLNFGNRTALGLWAMTWDEFVRTPSRFTAEAPNREERARLLAEVTAHGFIANYAGVRISQTGRRFRIQAATVWNVVDEAGAPAGQAATFDRWEWI